MRITRVKIENFRCLQDVEVFFDDTTTLIGPNGVGKSSVLRALDWFFNGTEILTSDDVCAGDSTGRIRVEVEFGSLDESDRATLGGYAPAAVETAILWKTWEDGTEQYSGKTRSYPAFVNVRRCQGATARRSAYSQLVKDQPDLQLGPANSEQAVLDQMLAWERANPDELCDSETVGTRLFGFLVGEKCSGVFDFVLVTADLRVREEALDTKSAIIGRLLERSVDRTVADENLAALNEEVRSRQSKIVDDHFAEKLKVVSRQLSEAVGHFTSGRQIMVRAQNVEMKPVRIQFEIQIQDQMVRTNIERQGHGFQRTLLLSALRLLAESSDEGATKGVICLAIEEPELYQHPAQAKAFSTVLRKLADDSTQNLQVMYATHNPLFIEPRRFEQVRRIVRRLNSEGVSSVEIFSANTTRVEQRLVNLVKADIIQKNINSDCLRRLSLALFADAIILVEGDTDRAVIEGAADRLVSLHTHNIAVVDVGGKDKLLLSRALLEQFGIPSVILADTDSGIRQRMTRDGKHETTIADAESQQKELNRKLLTLVNKPAMDWPKPGQYGDLFFMEDTLESVLPTKWPAWESTRNSLIQAGSGYDKKHSLTYYEAAMAAAQEPPEELLEVIEAARVLL